MRFSVETWAPEYGIAADADELVEAGGDVDLTVELPTERWMPIAPTASEQPERMMFVDGIRRIDARIWIHHDGGAHAGVCTSIAAGAVVASTDRADVTDMRIERMLLASAASGCEPITTRHGSYEFVPVASDDSTAVYQAIHDRMTALEHGVAADHDCELVVFDGPLRGRNDPCGVGYVKTQHVQYLTDEVAPTLAALGDGQRTPLMLISGRGDNRWSWYLRLPGPRTQPLAGIVRCEVPATRPVDDAITRADMVSSTLPRFASSPHKEPRAPQNLYPIAGLENTLRHRLGDVLLLERALRSTAATVGHT